ncbi:hypothetical protein [Pseudomonas sp. LP_7_YM]|uniref:hypothetical protein n=1 Tax=Pseudomonas sp. LP_7_YM TaxID=2485137 RepID=UPI0010ED551A|nr:hypothetical protein [Pseudomonas sp. LP_7_YM]TDV64322.1 hypothetical protein EC915_10525 [Pseudomonas sp. LP_7_YM]
MSPTPVYINKPSLMSFDKSAVFVLVAISLILVETFSGALRFYLDKAGVSVLLYAPKIACLLFFALELRSFKAGPSVWLSFLVLLLSSAWAVLNGAGAGNFAFALYGISPLLFGLTCGDQIARHKRLFMWVIAFALMASLAGIVLDKYSNLPWKGYSYSIGGTELSANTTWTAEDADRPAGFARISSALAIIISIFSLYLMTMVRSKMLAVAICSVGLAGVILTTSKAPVLAFAGAIGLLLITRFRWTTRGAIVVAVVLGMALPFIGLLYDLDPNKISTGSSLSSIYDRLINTWPNVIEELVSQGRAWTGAGFGLVGSSVAAFPVSGAEVFMVSDSTVVYLWAAFGLAGLFLYALHIPLFFILADSVSRHGRAMLATGFCICIVSWTTDTLEVTLANLFLGMAIGHALAARSRVRVVAPKPAEASSWAGLPGLS